ncbi:hypothetical protein NDU88_002546 [Pleurodeles waltl]|uniref:Uncharacterized protein n=1 Tax=Pleurodeles waltl TaxID=8319 RepID=A0AAV7M4H5_PLEWA|nr:hypothetical protein NDU88_002546 [Pleurodeles waltl]
MALVPRTLEDQGKLQLRQQELWSQVEYRARNYAITAQRRVYEVGDKAGKLLAWPEQRDSESSGVLKKENAESILQTTGITIAKAFAEYYEDLYASKTTMSTADCADFLRGIHLQVLQGEDRDALEVVMKEEEVAILDLQSGKAPGPNELPVDLYKGLTSTITGPRLAMFREVCERGCLPADQRAASITVIHKEGKP